MQVWFDVPQYLRNTWADVVHEGRYVAKLMTKENYV